MTHVPNYVAIVAKNAHTAMHAQIENNARHTVLSL